MPELPEVEVLKLSLSRFINKATIKKVEILNKNLRYKISHSLVKKLKGKKILKITRRAKYIIIHFENFFLLLHLGMTGLIFFNKIESINEIKTSFYYDKSNIKKKHNHFKIYFNNGLVMVYNDVRKFGFIKLLKNISDRPLSKLGPEPLGKSFNYNYFSKKIKNITKNIKNLLLDQHFVSGLGNIYVNEVLFESKLSPYKVARNINRIKVILIIKFIKKIIKDAIKKGGSSIKDYKHTDGEFGKYQDSFKVYGRKGLPCTKKGCNALIKRAFIGQRSTFFCPKCQK